MTRSLSIACIALVLCCLAGSARADDPKPKIAVLGLEATPNREGIVEPQTSDIARQITKELRERARGGSGGVVVAPNSDRELVDEKALANCDNEAASCMAAIGAGLSTNYLLYGRVERKGESYRVSLRLLDVKLRTVEQATGEIAGDNMGAVARKLYGKLVGKDSALVVINANAKAGKVMIDDEYKGKLVKGTVKISGISDGRHTLAIESVGYERYEASILVEHNETLNHTATMVEKDTGTGEPETGSGPWKGLFWTSTTLLALSAGAQAALYLDISLLEYRAEPNARFIRPGPKPRLTDADCDGFSGREDAAIFMNPEDMPLSKANRVSFDRACRDIALVNIGWITTPLLFAASGFFLYEWKFAHGGGEHPTQTAKHAQKGIDYAIVPVATTQSTGMTLFVRW